MADQPLNPNYIYHNVTASLAGKTADQKHFLKTSALVQNVQNFLPFTFTLRGITVTITSVNIVNGDVLSVICSAIKNGLALHVDNPLMYVNPPIMAPNGSTFVDSNGNTQAVMEELPLVAVKEIITQTIEFLNK